MSCFSYVVALPWMIVLVYQLGAARGSTPARRPGPYRLPRISMPSRQTALALACAVVVLVVTPLTTAVLMTSTSLSNQQYALEAIVLPSDTNASAKRAREQRIIASFSTERRLAKYLDAMQLPDSSILMDTVYGFAIYTATTRPKSFVIPSDEDFVNILNDPAANGIRYILAVPNTGRGVSDAINRRFPTLYDTGAEITPRWTSKYPTTVTICRSGACTGWCSERRIHSCR